MFGNGPEVAPVHAPLANQALVRLCDRLAQVLIRASEGVAEELDLKCLKKNGEEVEKRGEKKDRPKKKTKTKKWKREKTLYLLRPLPAHLHALEERRQRRVPEDAVVEDVDGVDQSRHAADAVEERR